MKKNKHLFWTQTGVLTSRYFHICLNNKQNLLLNFIIPLLTILIVCSVACDKMFSEKPSVDNSINKGYPVLTWEKVTQESKGKLPIHSSGIGKINSNQSLYFIFSENNIYSINNARIVIKSKNGEELKTYSNDDIKVVTMNNDNGKGTYSLYVETDVLKSYEKYNVSLFTDINTSDGNENKITVEVPNKLENVTDKVTKAKNDYKISESLSSDFNIDDFVANPNNQQKIATIPNSKIVVDNTEYILINDAETFAYIFSDKKDNNIKWEEQNYYLSCDINLNNYSKLKSLVQDKEYKGIFDGNGHIISNFKTKDCGLIAKLNGTVKNLGIENATVNSPKNNVGIVSGTLNKKGLIYNSYIKNSNVTGKESVGGFVGEIVDNSTSAEIYGCYAMDCNIKSDNNVAGIVGTANKGIIKSCYSVSDIKGNSDNKGEIVGNISTDGTLDNCYYLDSEDISAYGVNSSIDKSNVISTEGLDIDELKNASEKIAYKVNGEDNVYYFKTDGQLDEFSHTQTGLFMLVCVAIFVGICNSIQEVCKERNILKREYMTNLNLGSYILSKLIVQALLCALQMILVLGIFALFVNGKHLSTSGVIFGSIWIEYFITMFLLCFASDTLALFISSIVKNSSTANIFIPIVLIVQIVFSGVLFDLGNTFEKIAYLMFSKWGIAGLAITSHLNNARGKFLLDNPTFELQLGPNMSSVHSMFSSEVSNLLLVWGVLILFVIAFSVLSVLFLKRIKKDKR